MIETISAIIVNSGISFLVIVFLAKTWIKSRIDRSIEYEYKKQFNQKEKIELVAEILGEYTATPKGENFKREQRIKLNKLSFQSSLWLPSSIAIELSKRLQNEKDAKTIHEIILMARKELINDSSLNTKNITIWHAYKETQENSKIDIS